MTIAALAGRGAGTRGDPGGINWPVPLFAGYGDISPDASVGSLQELTSRFLSSC
jgi:hypothetical protein